MPSFPYSDSSGSHCDQQAVGEQAQGCTQNELDETRTSYIMLLWLGLLRCFVCSCTGVSVISFWTQLYCSELDTLTCKASCRCRNTLAVEPLQPPAIQASDFLGNSELLS